MNTRMKRSAVAAAVLSAGLTTVLASTASADFTERDEVLIDRTGYDVAGDGFTAGVPDAPAILEWVYSSTFGTYPQLAGTIHFDGADKCARVVLVSLDDDDTELGRTTGDTECPGTVDHYARTIQEGGVDGLIGEPGAHQVRVALQTQNADLSFSPAGSQTVTFGPELDVDPVQILREEFDLGDGDFEAGSPVGEATVRWETGNGEQIKPVLTGTLYAKNADDLCVRMLARYKDGDDVIQEVLTGREHCLDDDEPYEFSVNMNDHESYWVRSVTYVIQELDFTGVWQQAGATTVELGDGFIRNEGPIILVP